MGDTAFPMNGGDDAYSYSKNSQIQKEASASADEIIREAIVQKLELKIPTKVITVADLGCSVGPNTFFAVQNLIQALQNKFCDSKNDDGLIEFQVLFNDHIANDFNTLFASLPPERRYHAAGVPGSFHGRLFPRGSITLAYSSNSVHWLSRVPEGILNEGRILYEGESRDDVVLNAYLEQFQKDLGEFMRARAEEIVKGGLMFLSIPGIAEGVSHAHFIWATAFKLCESSLKDLADEGIIDKREIDGFNLPIYLASAEEVRKVIEENGCFSIERFEYTNSRSKVDGCAIIEHVRAVMERLFTQHFGDSVMKKMFSKTLVKAEEASHQLEAELYHSVQLVYVLKRK